MPTLSPKVRNSIYLALFLVNGTLAALVQQNVVPVAYAHWAALGSLVLAAAMKNVLAQDPPPAAPPAAP